VGGAAGAALLDLAQAAFVDGLGVTVLAAAAVMLAGALAAFALMPGPTRTPAPGAAPAGAPAPPATADRRAKVGA
jgi:hypothetical protein